MLLLLEDSVGLAAAPEMVVEEGVLDVLADPPMVTNGPTDTVIALGSAVNVAVPETVTVTAA